MREIYLDNNATTLPLPEVREAVMAVLGEGFGNPASPHSAGARARRSLEDARASVAALVDAREDDVVFTSSGTEANNLVLLGCLANGGRLVTTKVEHSSVLKTVDHLEEAGCEVVRLALDRGGHVSLDELDAALTPSTTLLSIQWVNNETGVVQPMAEIARLCERHGIPLHTDAAQAVGKVPIRLSELPMSFLTCTAHKLHGPQGVGALVTSRRSALRPLEFGGPQEFGLRPGTENLPGIVGFGVAAQLRLARFDDVAAKLSALRDRFEAGLLSRLSAVTINGHPDHRVSNSSNLCFAGIDGQALVARLDGLGIRCSQSSACTSSRPEPSYVLRSMGLTEDEAYASVRFSVSELNTPEEIDRAIELIVREVASLRDLLGYSAHDERIAVGGIEA